MTECFNGNSRKLVVTLMEQIPYDFSTGPTEECFFPKGPVLSLCCAHVSALFSTYGVLCSHENMATIIVRSGQTNTVNQKSISSALRICIIFYLSPNIH